MSLRDQSLLSIACKQERDTIPIITIKSHFRRLNYPNDVVLEQSRRDETRTSPRDRSHFVSLPLHPISSLPASLLGCSSTSAHATSCPKLHSTASRPLASKLVVAPLGSHDATSSHSSDFFRKTFLHHALNLRRQCAMLGSIACASLFICICTREKKTQILPLLTLNIR
jgi:hypothetical protein